MIFVLVRVPATAELTFRHRQGQGTDMWQHVTSLDNFCGVMIALYNSKRKRKKIFVLANLFATTYIPIFSLTLPLSKNHSVQCDLILSFTSQECSYVWTFSYVLVFPIKLDSTLTFFLFNEISTIKRMLKGCYVPLRPF